MIESRMMPADVYEPYEDDGGDLGTVTRYKLLKPIECAISFGGGNAYVKDGVLTTDSTHKGLTRDRTLKADMRIFQNGKWYRISVANNDSARLAVLYLEYTPVSPI